VGREVQRSVEGAVKEFEPVVRFHTLSDFSVNATVVLRGTEFTSSYPIKHEFIKLLHERYQQEGIEIPFPVRTIRQAAH
jgi:small-conductance mechanosensitive channel